MIKIKDLTVAFDNTVILDSINMEIFPGEIAVILGKNGAGKSILLKTIAGLIDQYEGKIEIENIDLKELYKNRFKKIKGASVKNKLAYIFQRGGLFDSMDVFDNIAFALRRMGFEESSVSKLVSDTLTRVGLSGSENRLPSELSGGMQKRVGLARAVCLNPEIILYDDPTAGLDPVLSDSIADLIIEIKREYKTTSLVATHDLKIARKIADSIALIYNGNFIFNGKTDDFFSSDEPATSQFITGDIKGPIDIY